MFTNAEFLKEREGAIQQITGIKGKDYDHFYNQITGDSKFELGAACDEKTFSYIGEQAEIFKNRTLATINN